MGAANFFSAKVREVDAAIVSVTSPAGFETALLCHGHSYRKGDPLRFVVRPEKLEMWLAEPPPAEARACMEVTIEDRLYQGVATVWTVRNRAGERMSIYQQNVARGQSDEFTVMGKAWVCWDPRHGMVMREDGSQ
jgi:ABC-type Fe3+/spermidine/putrescine transport system ATPase subunit